MKLLLFFITFSIFQGNKTLKKCDELILQGVEAMDNKEYAKSLELLTEAKTLAENNSWHRQRFLAVNNIGLNYYTMFDYGEALNNYLEAYTIAIKELDPNHEMIVLNNIAILYSMESQLDKAEEYFKKAYDIAKSKKDFLKVGLYGVNLGLVANEQNNLQKGKAYFEEAIPLLQNHPTILLQAEMGMAENYFLQKELTRAKDLSLKLLKEFKDMNADDFNCSVLLTLSRVYEAEDNMDRAIYYARQCLDLELNRENKITVYQWLAELYEKNNDLRMALQAKDSLIATKDDFNLVKNGRLFETNKVKFEIQNYQKELLDNKDKLLSERRTFYTLLVFSIGAIMLFGWALYNTYIKNTQRREIMALELEKEKSDKLLLEKQIVEKDTLGLLEQERLKNEIESRNRKIAAKALQLSNRNELIEQIIDSISGQSEISKNNTLSQYVKQLKEHLKKDSEWESFLTHFEEVNRGFLNSLKEKHPFLSSNDLRFLSYMYMNLSIKEISLLLNITSEACRKRKERITKKMNIPQEMDLYDYISSV